MASEPGIQPLTHRGMALYSVASVGTNVVAAFTNAALPLFLLPYGLPGWLVGLLAQERSGVGGLVQPLIGMLSDRTRTRFGKRRPYFLIGAPTTALALFALAFHPPLVPMIALVSILALLLAVANDPYLALMADLAPERQRGRLGSYMGIFGMAGQVLMLVAAGFLWESHETLVIWGIGVVLVVCFAITFFGVREPTAQQPMRSTARPVGARAAVPPWPNAGAAQPLPADGSLASIQDDKSPVPHPERNLFRTFRPLQYLREVLSHREVAKYSLAMTFFWLGGGCAAPFITRFGVLELGMSEGASFSLMMLLVLCTGIFAYPAGLVGDRFGKKAAMSIGLIFFAAAILVGSQAQTMEQILPAILLIGVGNTIPFVLNFPMLIDLIPQERAGEFVGLGSMLWSVGQPFGALIGGALADVTGGYRVTFIFAGVMMIAAFLVLQTVRPHPRQLPVPAALAA